MQNFHTIIIIEPYGDAACKIKIFLRYGEVK